MNDADKLISLGMPHEIAKRVADRVSAVNNVTMALVTVSQLAK